MKLLLPKFTTLHFSTWEKMLMGSFRIILHKSSWMSRKFQMKNVLKLYGSVKSIVQSRYVSKLNLRTTCIWVLRWFITDMNIYCLQSERRHSSSSYLEHSKRTPPPHKKKHQIFCHIWAATMVRTITINNYIFRETAFSFIRLVCFDFSYHVLIRSPFVFYA